VTAGDCVIGYLRVSSAEQGSSGAGLESQRQSIEAECARHGWQLLRIEEDVLSAKNMKRPGLQRALDACRSGEATGLVVAKLDRLSRSLMDFAAMVEEAQKRGYSIVCVDQAFDLGTSNGCAMAGMLAVFAAWEREIIGERTKAALAVKQAQGVKLGRPRTMPDELRARIRRMRKRGLSLPAIVAKLNEEQVATAHGGRRWYPSTVRAALT
jgi:DNA invertase Pin-like site-specific DNA recombinase